MVVALLGSTVLTRALSIVMVPVYLSTLGPRKYGVWLAASATAGFLQSIDPGSYTAVVAINQAAALGDIKLLQRTFSAALFATSAFAGIGSILAALVFWFVNGPDAFHKTSDEATLTLLCCLYVLWSLPYRVITGLYSSIGAAAKWQWISCANTLVVALLSTVVLLRGAEANALAILQIASLGWTATFAWYHVRRRTMLAGLRFSQGHILDVKRLARPAIDNVVLQFGNILSQQGVLLVVKWIAGPESVAAFSVARTVAMLGKEPISIASTASMPEITRLEALQQKNVLQLWHKILLTFVFTAVTPFSVALLSIGNSVISTWTRNKITLTHDLLVPLLLLCLTQSLVIANMTLGASCNKYTLSAVARFSSGMIAILTVFFAGVSSLGPVVWIFVVVETLTTLPVSIYEVSKLTGSAMTISFLSLTMVIVECHIFVYIISEYAVSKNLTILAMKLFIATVCALVACFFHLLLAGERTTAITYLKGWFRQTAQSVA